MPYSARSKFVHSERRPDATKRGTMERDFPGTRKSTWQPTSTGFSHVWVKGHWRSVPAHGDKLFPTRVWVSAHWGRKLKPVSSLKGYRDVGIRDRAAEHRRGHHWYRDVGLTEE